MEKPTRAGDKPIKVNLTAGQKYFFCTCGNSANQPFCDGAHKGTSFTPKVCVAEEDGDVFLCQCKQTNNAPFCDGAHSKDV